MVEKMTSETELSGNFERKRKKTESENQKSSNFAVDFVSDDYCACCRICNQGEMKPKMACVGLFLLQTAFFCPNPCTCQKKVVTLHRESMECHSDG